MIEDGDEEVKELLNMLLVFPCVHFSISNLACQVQHELFKDYRYGDESLVEHRLQNLLARFSISESLELDLFFLAQFAISLDILLLKDSQKLVAVRDHELLIEVLCVSADDLLDTKFTVSKDFVRD